MPDHLPSEAEERLHSVTSLMRIDAGHPVSFLALDYIQSAGVSTQEIEEWASGRGLECEVFREFECVIKSGAIFVWNEPQLAKQTPRGIEPKQIVRYLAQHISEVQ